jgi:Rrf2 family protein
MHLLAREEAGLRCLLRVALRGASGAPVPIARIAAGEELSGVYAAKLMRQLRLAGLVESTRGTAGGYLLSRPAEQITVWDAIQALDQSFLPESDCDCDPADRVDCRRTPTCAVSSLWRRLGDEIRRALEAVTLAELCEGALERSDRVELPTLTRNNAQRKERKARTNAHSNQRSSSCSLSS